MKENFVTSDQIFESQNFRKYLLMILPIKLKINCVHSLFDVLEIIMNKIYELLKIF